MLAQDVDLGLGETELGVGDGGWEDGGHGYIYINLYYMVVQGECRRGRRFMAKRSKGVIYDLKLGREIWAASFKLGLTGEARGAPICTVWLDFLCFF